MKFSVVGYTICVHVAGRHRGFCCVGVNSIKLQVREIEFCKNRMRNSERERRIIVQVMYTRYRISNFK